MFAYIVDTVASCFHCNEVVTATVSTTKGLIVLTYYVRLYNEMKRTSCLSYQDYHFHDILCYVILG